jgi:hypothetical protein
MIDFSDSQMRYSLLGAIIGFGASFTSGPILRILIPLIAVASVGLALNRMGDHLKGRFGLIGSAIAAAAAYLLEPVKALAEGALKGVMSLFASFLLTVFGYFAAQYYFDYRSGDDEEVADGDFQY